MNILVTGCKGTLGIPLVAELKKRGHTVYGCDIKHERDNNYIRCDISEYRQLERVFSIDRIDFVFNLAAEFGRINGEEYYEKVWKTNVIGLRNILEIQKNLRFKLIHASSSEIYGELGDLFGLEMKKDILYYKEDMIPAKQKNDYAISKWVNELQCENFMARYKNQIMILRFFNAYGPGEYYNNYRSVVCLFCYRAIKNIPYQVYENYHRVFMYIDDFIPTLANCVEKFMPGEIINIGGDDYRSVKELSDIILKELGMSDSLVEYVPLDLHNVVNKRPDITKAKKLLGHNPKIKLEEGIERTIHWMKEIYE